jgi:hypothetical protein
MKSSRPSCTVALSTERNHATDAEAATVGATSKPQTVPKSTSLQELRAQLRAQLARNQYGTEDAPKSASVALVAGAVGTTPTPMTANEEAAIRAWLALIKETDPTTIAEMIGQCQRDTDARDYFTGRAAAELPKPDPLPAPRKPRHGSIDQLQVPTNETPEGHSSHSRDGADHGQLEGDSAEKAPFTVANAA